MCLTVEASTEQEHECFVRELAEMLLSADDRPRFDARTLNVQRRSVAPASRFRSRYGPTLNLQRRCRERVGFRECLLAQFLLVGLSVECYKIES